MPFEILAFLCIFWFSMLVQIFFCLFYVQNQISFCSIQNRWLEMFPCLVARTSTTDVISSGMGGTRNGALQLVSIDSQS